MHRFRTTLVPGSKAPYDSWTFVVLPSELVASWQGGGPFAVRGTLAGHQFRGTVSRGEGVYRMPVPRALRERAGVACRDVLDVAIEIDPEPRPIELPLELRAVLDGDAEVSRMFEGLPPAHRRAWAAYVGEAKRPETRLRRASKAPAGIRARAFPGA